MHIQIPLAAAIFYIATAFAFAYALGIIVTMPANDKLQQINRKVDILINRGKHMAGELDALTTEVTNATTVEQSAITLIQGLAAQLAAAGTDPVKLQALKDSLSASDAALAAAVVANTK